MASFASGLPAPRGLHLHSVGLGLVLLGRRGPASRRGGGTLPRMVSMAAAAALLAAGAGPALALDATGTWSGKRNCRPEARGGGSSTERRDSTMRITQRGDALFIDIDGTAYWGR